MEMEENSRLYVGLWTPIISCLIHAHLYPLHLYSTLFLAVSYSDFISTFLKNLPNKFSTPSFALCNQHSVRHNAWPVSYVTLKWLIEIKVSFSRCIRFTKSFHNSEAFMLSVFFPCLHTAGFYGAFEWWQPLRSRCCSWCNSNGE